MDNLPAYRDLLTRTDGPPGSSWGLWGAGDAVGTLNLLTPERVRAAMGSVRRGAVFPLNWDLDLPEPAIGRRGKPRHHVISRHPWVRDDLVDNLYLHGSTHWDALSHVGCPEVGYYNGVQPAAATSRNGIEHMARRGIVGRGVLLDLGPRLSARGLDYEAASPIGVDDLEAARHDQGVDILPGDILLVRTGWMAHYLRQDQRWRDRLAQSPTIPGLAATPSMFAFLWDHHVAALAADNYAVEAFPFAPARAGSLHANCLGLLGLPLGEFFDLEALAADCARDGAWAFLLTSAPLHLAEGTASPPNALAIK
jgi:kynurenine formamidase